MEIIDQKSLENTRRKCALADDLYLWGFSLYC